MSDRMIAVLSLSLQLGENHEMFDSIQKQMEEYGYETHYHMLHKKDLDGELMFDPEKYHAVILIHSVKEGRLSITDVEDAKYNTLLPALWKEFGSKHVGVIAFSVPGCNENTKERKIVRFKTQQPTAAICSDNVILCGSSGISEDDGNFLYASFENIRPPSPRKDVENDLIIGIKPLIPLLIMQHIERGSNRRNLTLKTLDACEDIAENTFFGTFIVCKSREDVEIFRDAINEAKDNVMYVEAMNEAKLKGVFLPQDSSLKFSDRYKTSRYNFNSEENSVSFPQQTKIKEHLGETIREEGVGRDSRVLVTDAAGFIASHIIQQLTKAGYKVRGTLRSLGSQTDRGILRELFPGMELREAQINQPVLWPEAVDGCRYVIHTSCFQHHKPAEEFENYITNLLQVCHEKRVERVVITGPSDLISAAVKKKALMCKEWDTSDSALNDVICKCMSENAATAFIENQTGEKPSLGLSIIKPAVVLGPILCNPDEAYVEIVRRRMKDARSGVKDISIPVCDVRDVAKAHIMALEQTESVVTNPGVIPHNWSLHGFEGTLRSEFEKQGYKFVLSPRSGTWPKNWTNPMNYFWDDESSCLRRLYGSQGFPKQTDCEPLVTARIVKEASLLDMAYCCIDRGFIEKKPGYIPRKSDQ